jgi:TRAP-type C4-dicarboxylate transport system permease small subunit
LLQLAGIVEAILAFVCKGIVLLTVGALTIMLTLNIVARYALEMGGFAWVGELPEQLFPWLIAAGIVLAARNGSHIAVDFALTRFHPQVSRIVALLVHVLIAISYFVLLVVVLRVAEIAALERSPLLGLPRSYGYFALAFGCGGTALISLVVFVRIWCYGLGAMPKGHAEDQAI